jgi:hypothetical protein
MLELSYNAKLVCPDDVNVHLGMHEVEKSIKHLELHPQ